MQKTVRSILLIAPIVLIVFCNAPLEPERFNHRPLQMKLVPGGTFIMGTNDSTHSIDWSAIPTHQVTVDSFYMDSTEVTQREYWQYYEMRWGNKATNPAYWASPYNPVENVSWFDAVLFCNARSRSIHYDTVYSYSAAYFRKTETGFSCSTLTDIFIDYNKKGYRLPTEAEWEYACRAGTATMCFWGIDDKDQNVVDVYAWFTYNSAKLTHKVGVKLPNPWGLYDMIGNVEEWCNDWFREGYLPGSTDNPIGSDSSSERVYRGGAYNHNNTTGGLARPATRKSSTPEMFAENLGFRCILKP